VLKAKKQTYLKPRTKADALGLRPDVASTEREAPDFYSGEVYNKTNN
jgi:hypothetical protein